MHSTSLWLEKRKTSTSLAAKMETGAIAESSTSSLEEAAAPHDSQVVESEGQRLQEETRNDASRIKANESNKKEPYHSLLQVVRLWSEDTSVHGMKYAFDPDFFAWKRLAWSVIVTAMAVIMVIAILALFNDYFQYNTKTSTYATFPPRLPFPEITVCNANAFQKSLKEQYNISWPKNEAQVNLISQSFDDFMMDAHFNNFSYFQQLSASRQRAALDMKSNWRPVITHNGRCWAFSTEKMVTVPGQNGGLSFIVNLQQYEYTEDTVTAGIALSVAQPGTKIVEQMTVTAASPGNLVAISFIGTQVCLETRKPWSSCTGEAPEYTQFLCRDECLNRAKAKTCGCRPMGDTQPELKSLDYCGPRDEVCTNNQTAFAFENCNCTMPPCRESQFKVKSTGQRMSRNFQRSIESYLNVTENYFADNIVMLTLNYETMTLETLEEERTQGPYELMASLGGVTGLYMGVSLISIIEILGELFGLRLIPRLWGDDRLYGVGGRT